MGGADRSQFMHQSTTAHTRANHHRRAGDMVDSMAGWVSHLYGGDEDEVPESPDPQCAARSSYVIEFSIAADDGDVCWRALAHLGYRHRPSEGVDRDTQSARSPT